MAENPYFKALGYDSPGDRVPTVPGKLIDVKGIAVWGASKAPAVAGAYIAQELRTRALKYEMVKKYIGKWGTDVVLSVIVFFAAYALQFYGTKWKPESARLFDRMTDGMVGYMGLGFIRAIKILLNKTGLTKFDVQAADGVGNCVGLDGDREAIMAASGLFANSPETLRLMAEHMFEAMREQGVDINGEGKEAIVRSMHEVSNSLAQGLF